MAKKQPEPARYDQLKAKVSELNTKVQNMAGSAHTTMKDNPLATAGIAFGIGVLAGVGLKILLDSKRRD